MTVLRAQIRFRSAFQAEDDMMNTWHFKGQRAEADNATDMIEDFYTVTSGYFTSALTQAWTTRVLSNEYEIKVYDLEDPKPRTPIYTRQGNAPMGNSNALPTQCSIVMTYEAEGISGIRIQRMRNRVYLGGWGWSACDTNGMVMDSTQQLIAGAARKMLDESEASINLTWCTFSPTIAAGATDIEDAAFPVARGWIDNSFDIQRRRKVDADSREEWPPPD